MTKEIDHGKPTLAQTIEDIFWMLMWVVVFAIVVFNDAAVLHVAQGTEIKNTFFISEEDCNKALKNISTTKAWCSSVVPGHKKEE